MTRLKAVQSTFSHWEGNLMNFCQNSQHILVLRERKTFFIQSSPLQNKKAQSGKVAHKLAQIMKNMLPQARQSIILDNRGKFAFHEKWLKYLQFLSFFCDPYASWQKGSIKKTNQRLRQALPRKTNILTMTKDNFHETIDKL